MDYSRGSTSLAVPRPSRSPRATKGLSHESAPTAVAPALFLATAVAYVHTGFAALRKWTPQPSPSTPSSRPSASAAQRSKPQMRDLEAACQEALDEAKRSNEALNEAKTDLELCKLDLEAAQLGDRRARPRGRNQSSTTRSTAPRRADERDGGGADDATS